MKRHAELALVCPLVWLALSVAAARCAETRPNVVVILADDQGWGDLSVHGNTNIQTPRIDSLAREGALFDRFYACALCAPTRAEFLTGRYHPRGGVHGVSTGAERLNIDEKTIADAFRAAGYATGAFGKWHNGSQFPYHPNARGFAEYYGFTSGHWGQYFDPMLEHNGEFVRGKGFIIDDLTDHALAFIDQHRDTPFFCYLPLNTPHSPFQVPDEYWNRYRDREIGLKAKDPKLEELDATRCVLAMTENIDWNVGRVLTRLDELKLAERTIVLYFSDNGPNTWRWNGGMKGRKGTLDEGGLRVPCLVRWPGHIQPATRISQIAGAIDLLPTLCSLAGVPVVGEKPLDGRDLKPLLCGPSAEWPERMLFSQLNNRVTVRTQRYRLDPEGALYDMQADPEQKEDVSKRDASVAKQLGAAVADWKKEVLPGIAKDDRPFPVGYAEFPVAPLPARDGVPSGGVKRSAGAPNCSYFTNWKSTADVITWDIEVAASGKYEAVLYYTCAAENVGSAVELAFHGTRWSGKVSEAFDPPLITNMDRVRRNGESYVKDFKPLSLGTAPLEKGRGLLTLRAASVPGKQVMDLRGITLRWLSQ